MNEESVEIGAYPVSADEMTTLLKNIVDGKLDQTRAKEVLESMIGSGDDVQQTMDKLGIKEVDGSEIDALCQQLIDENPDVIKQIKDGNTKAVGALIGKARKLNPNANPSLIRTKILEAVGV